MNLYKRKAVSRLGLMHLAATNLCIWLKELLQEVEKARGQVEVVVYNSSLGNSTTWEEEDRCGGSILAQLRLDSRDYLFPCLAQYCLVSRWAGEKKEQKQE